MTSPEVHLQGLLRIRSFVLKLNWVFEFRDKMVEKTENTEKDDKLKQSKKVLKAIKKLEFDNATPNRQSGSKHWLSLNVNITLL